MTISFSWNKEITFPDDAEVHINPTTESNGFVLAVGKGRIEITPPKGNTFKTD